jgi:hypothetical protein
MNKTSISKLVALLIISISLTSCSNKLKEFNQKLRIGPISSNSFEVMGNKIPLNGDNWYLITHNLNRDQWLDIRLFKIEEGVLAEYITIAYREKVVARGGYMPSKVCNRKNLYFLNMLANTRGSNQECWLVNHNTGLSFSGNNKSSVETQKYVADNEILLPKTVIQRFHRFANKRSNYLSVSYHYNPEISGFEPDKSDKWSNSDWNRINVASDSRKTQYLENIVETGKQIHQKIKNSLAFIF